MRSATNCRKNTIQVVRKVTTKEGDYEEEGYADAYTSIRSRLMLIYVIERKIQHSTTTLVLASGFV
jgi:hypothetical protein